MGRTENLNRQSKSSFCVKHPATGNKSQFLKSKTGRVKVIKIAIPSLSNLKMDADPSMTPEELESNELVFILNQARLKLEKDLQSTEQLLNTMHTNEAAMLKNELNITSVQKCPVCYEIYDKARTLPVCMPCGHTICKVCACTLKLHHAKISCPLDRKVFDAVADFLPINHALLEASEEKAGARCKEHGMLIIGFCLDHQTLLCGKCLFLHKTHNAIDIESFEAQTLIIRKCVSYERLEESIQYLTSLWTSSFKTLLETSLDMKHVLLSFITLQKINESQIRNKLHLGILDCIENVFSLTSENTEHNIIGLGVIMSTFTKYLETLTLFRRDFVYMSDTDKLNTKLPTFDAKEKSSESSLFSTLSDLSQNPAYFEEGRI